jgi:hypothetical protein
MPEPAESPDGDPPITALSHEELSSISTRLPDTAARAMRHAIDDLSHDEAVFAAGACRHGTQSTYYLVTPRGVHYAELQRGGLFRRTRIVPRLLSAESVGVVQVAPHIGNQALVVFAYDESADNVALSRLVDYGSDTTPERLAVTLGSVLNARSFLAAS